MKKYLIIGILNLFCLTVYAQDKDLGEGDYIIIKPYKPELAESNKISDTPQGDTASSNAPKMTYDVAPRKLETNFEAGVIKAVKIKDEPLPKLYHSLVKLGLGNYNTYTGEFFYNTIRSKTGQAGVHLKHFSGRPLLIDDHSGQFSQNKGEVYGKYFLDHATFNSRFAYDRDVFHYYGFYGTHGIPEGAYIPDSDSTKQRFNNFNFSAGIKSNWISGDHLDYDATLEYNGINDLYDVKENNFMVRGGVGKKFDENYFGLNLNFDYFKKTEADFEVKDAASNLNRNIVSANPYFKRDFDRIHLNVGFNVALEHNVGATEAHFYPDVKVSVPVAENIVYVFADVTGGLVKKNYKTLTDENPFLIPSAKMLHNESNDIVLDGGVKGNFSSKISFLAMIKYSKMSNMNLFVNDTSMYIDAMDTTVRGNMFNIVYDDGNLLDLHAEVSYRSTEKLTIALAYDYLSWDVEHEQKAWHKPGSEARLMLRYNLKDKIQANVTFLTAGSQYARTFTTDSIPQVVPVKVKGYYDFNLGLEYRYSKLLSFYFNMNNLFFSKYEQWYGYPSEKFNFLGGLTYSF